MQTSQPWDGIAIGDASRARYDADEWTEMFQDMFDSDVNRGVLRSRGGELAGTLISGNTQFRIASGAALVKGRWYNNNANVDFTPGAAGAPWREDRIVLSCTWNDINDVLRDPAIQTAQTIKLIRRINPADGGGATGPTQTEGVLWEIPLYRITITGGVITASLDDREFLLADTAAAGMYDAYVCVRDVKAQNTDGGAFNLGAWQTRDINDEHADTAGICAVGVPGPNQITLQAGTYRCYITCPSFYVQFCKARLQNITDGVTLVLGSSSGSGNIHNPDQALIKGRFTLAAPKVLEVQHYGTRTQAGNGFGQAGNIDQEIYTVAEFWRES